MKVIYFFISFLISLVVCLLAPDIYNHDYSVACVSMAIVNILLYIFLQKKTNYFDFDNLFFVSFLFVTFYYTVYMYETDPYRYIFYELYFDKNTLPLSSGLSLLGISGYILGAVLVSTKREKENVQNTINFKFFKKINTTPLFLLSLFFLLLYVVSGGYEQIMMQYIGGGVDVVQEEGAISQYFFALFPAFMLSGIIGEAINLKKYNPDTLLFLKINKVAYICVGLIFFMFLLIGSRTIPIQIVLTILGIYSLLYKPVSLSKFSFFIVIGFVLFAVIGFFRQVSNKYEEFHLEDSAMDFIVNNRNTYVVIDYVKDNGFTYGESMLSPFLAPIPFLQSAVVKIFGFDQDMMRSALITTKATFGEVGTWGLGTNIVADVYLAFGIVGIAFLFPILGFSVNYARINALTSIKSFISYAVIVGFAVYLARAEYFYFLRFLLWCLIILSITLKIQKK